MAKRAASRASVDEPAAQANHGAGVHDICHVLLYGESGSGKSTGAATFDPPLLVLAFDPTDKLKPYLKLGTPSSLEQDDLGTDVREVFGDDGTLLCRVEYYIDHDPQAPDAYQRLLDRLAVRNWHEGFNTVVLDSVTFCELAARKFAQYVLNPHAKDPRQWYGASTESLEELVMIRLAGLQKCVVVVAHVDEDRDEVMGYMVRNPAFPGRLRKRAASGYGELYRAFVRRTDDGEREYLWQTKSSQDWNASSQINAPDPVAADYHELWQR